MVDWTDVVVLTRVVAWTRMVPWTVVVAWTGLVALVVLPEMLDDAHGAPGESLGALRIHRRRDVMFPWTALNTLTKKIDENDDD